MKKRQRLTLFLAFIMLFTAILTSCGGNDDSERTVEWSLGTEGRSAVPDNLPDDLDLKGYEFQIFHRAGFVSECEGFDGDGADPVNVTVYERNRKVENRLNCKLTWYPSSGTTYDTVATEITNILNQNQYYDFILSTQNSISMYGKSPYLCDMTVARYIDLEQDWWWLDGVMNELSYDGGRSIKFLVGDINISNFTKLGAVYFNTTLVDEHLYKTGTCTNLYDLVESHEWTLELFYSLVRDFHRDTDDGYSGIRNQGDVFGFPWAGNETIRQFLYSTSVVNTLYQRNGDTVTLNYVGNRAITDLVEQMTSLFWCEGAWSRMQTDANGKESGSVFDTDMVTEFTQGQYVFLPQRLTAATGGLRNMSNFGILPYPLLYKGDDYVSYTDTSATTICVPITVKTADNSKLDRVGAVLEALCSESYRWTIDAFYKNALQERYTRSNRDIDMIDLIYESATTSFAIYNVGIPGAHECIKQNNITLLSQYINEGNIANQQSSLNSKIKDALKERDS